LTVPLTQKTVDRQKEKTTEIYGYRAISNKCTTPEKFRAGTGRPKDAWQCKQSYAGNRESPVNSAAPLFEAQALSESNVISQAITNAVKPIPTVNTNIASRSNSIIA
jgi:hypothetical protein